MEKTFKPLIEKASEIDVFKHQTHEKIASTLNSLLISNKGKAQTIGLEGVWGSGKSTVIQLLKSKLPKNDFSYFYFDAWAHEGDPLRRVFLESLLKNLEKNDALTEIGNRVSNRIKNIKTKTTKSTTKLGKILSISIIFVPLGASIISTLNFSNLGLFRGAFCPELFWGIILTLAPALVLFANFIFLLCSQTKSVKDIKGWAFLENETDTEVTQEISEEVERSSIEFERYFEEIIEIAFNGNNKRQLVIIVDNLDRIDAQDSLKIWSTLQTFLKQRNPAQNIETQSQNIWIIVPYDAEGLSKLWNNNESKKPTDDNKDNLEIAGSFFDKCFQIRLEVPKPIFSDWEDFTSQMIDSAFDVNFKYKDDIINTIRITRNIITDIPTPREIKTYINQLGILWMNSDSEMPLASVSYYAILRYMRKEKVEAIQRKLIEGSIPEPNHKELLPTTIVKDLAGLSFGVSSEVGHQLLLEPELSNKLKNYKEGELIELLKVHQNGFWYVFDYHIERLKKAELFSYSESIYKELWKEHKKNCKSFLKGFSQIKLMSFSSVKEINKHISFLQILIESNHSIISYWDSIIEFINKSFNSSLNNPNEIIELLKEIVVLIPEKDLKPYTIDSQNIENWIIWAKVNKKYNQTLYKWIKPKENYYEELSGRILPGSPIEDGIFEVTEYFHHAKKREWQTMIGACNGHINWNNGQSNTNQHSIIAIKILFLLSEIDDNLNFGIKEELDIPYFYNFIYFQNTNNTVVYGALILGHYLGNDLHSKTISPPVGNSNTGLQNCKSFWLTRDIENAKLVLDLLNGRNNIIWNLAENVQNKLIVDILKHSILDEKYNTTFKVINGLEKFSNSLKLIETENDILDVDLAVLFKNQSDILAILTESDNLDVVLYSEEICYFIEDLVYLSLIIGKISQLSKEDWDVAFKDDSYLTSLALLIKKQRKDFSLENNFYDSLLEHLKKCNIDDRVLTDWQLNNWEKLVDLLGDDFLIQFKNNLTVYFSSNFNLDHIKLIEINLNLIDKEKVLSTNVTIIQSKIEELIKVDSSTELLNEILLLLSDIKLKFEPSFKKVIQEPLSIAWNNTINEEFKIVLQKISLLIGVKIKPIIENKES